MVQHCRLLGPAARPLRRRLRRLGGRVRGDRAQRAAEPLPRDPGRRGGGQHRLGVRVGLPLPERARPRSSRGATASGSSSTSRSCTCSSSTGTSRSGPARDLDGAAGGRPSAELRAVFRPACAFGIAAWAVAIYFFVGECYDTGYGAISGYILNTMMSALYVVIILRHGHLYDFSLLVAWSKMLGTALLTVFNFVVQSDNPYLLFALPDDARPRPPLHRPLLRDPVRPRRDSRSRRHARRRPMSPEPLINTAELLDACELVFFAAGGLAWALAYIGRAARDRTEAVRRDPGHRRHRQHRLGVHLGHRPPHRPRLRCSRGATAPGSSSTCSSSGACCGTASRHLATPKLRRLLPRRGRARDPRLDDRAAGSSCARATTPRTASSPATWSRS